MKKIAILTFSRAFNYGAVLQAYALKQVLAKLHAKPFCLNYYAPFYPDTTFTQKLSLLCKKIIKASLGKPFVPQYFTEFIITYLKDTPPLFQKDLRYLNDRFDLFITGSDQVWNFTITKNDPAFLLDFVTDSQKKISYAASFGFSYVEEKNKLVFAQLLRQFAHISVREQTGAKIVKELTGKEVPVVLDPTLLLTKDSWEIFSKPIKRENYVLMYLLHNNQKLITFAKSLAAQKGLTLRCLTFRPIRGLDCFLCTPEEFVGYFQNASYVVTNSFHGLAFSINLNKTFFVDLLPPSWPANSRLEQLLKTTGLENRLLDNLTDIEAPIDWVSVENRLQAAREKSIKFLQSVLTDEKPH